MAQFSVNAQRFDPYKNFKFRVKWDGRYVAGVSKVSGLKRTTEVVKHREGGDPSSTRKSPGRTEYEAITIERGVTHDTEFEKWANKVWNFGAGQFSVNAQRFDPYKNFKFRVKWDGRYVAGISKVSGLKRTTEVVKHREGGDPSSTRKSPGRTEYDAITIERGVTHDTEFEKWANKVWNFGAGLGAEVSLKDFRKDLILEVYNEAGQLALAYKIYRCWVSEYQAMPDLDANANAVAIQHLKLENEGWERDAGVPEPAEPSYTVPAG